MGDSITRRRWATDPQYRALLKNWATNFFGWNAANFGRRADRIENILWRLENGELDGVNPRIISFCNLILSISQPQWNSSPKPAHQGQRQSRRTAALRAAAGRK